MSGKLVTEEQLRERLLKVGKTSEEIEQLIDQYAEASHNEFPNTKAISEILRKTQEDSISSWEFLSVNPPAGSGGTL